MVEKKINTSIILLLFLFGCTSSLWQSEENQSHLKEHESKKLTYKVNDSFHGLELEIIQLSDNFHLFLNATLQKFSEINSEIPITITTNEIKQIFPCSLHLGGGRILLTNKASKMIIDSLNNKNRVQITVGSDTGYIEPSDEFPKLFHNLISNTH